MADLGVARRAPDEAQPARRGAPAPLRAVLGVLDDGTPHYAPVGAVWDDGEQVCCHVCGGWYRSVGAHLVSHGWSRAGYRAAFGLEVGASLEAAATRRRRAESFAPRRVFEPAVREGVARGHALARSGELARHAARASTGRPQPAQRRAKTLKTLADAPPERRAEANRRRRQQDLRGIAAAVASEQGFADLTAYVVDRVSRGESLAGASRAAGLHANWLQRHLASVAPDAVEVVAENRRAGADLTLVPVVRRLGFAGVGEYLTHRHLVEHRTVRALSLELGVSRARVEAALDRHGLVRSPHAAGRAAALRREAEVCALLGVGSLADHVARRRAEGATWDVLAAGCGVPTSWLRRRVAAWQAEAPAARVGDGVVEEGT